MQSIQPKFRGVAERTLVGGIVFVVLLFLGVSISRAAEIVPSIGISKNTSGGDARFSTGVALRTSMMIPFVKGELGVQWHRDTYQDGSVNATSWPVTASVWFAPVPFFYAGGGAGWYQSTYSVKNQPLIASVTDRTFGTHVGGGFSMPLAPMLGLDLNARYVRLEKKSNSLIPSNYDPSFWTTSLGLAVKF
jgi:hypothetical protein